MISAKARAVYGADKPFQATEIKRRDLDLHDVLIEIKYAGICHSDIHTAHGECDLLIILLYQGMKLQELLQKFHRK